MTPRPVSLALALALIACPLLAQQDIDIERGFRAGASYEAATNIDTTNLFNGTVNLAIPLGQTYVVGGTLSYSFSAHYATNAWDAGFHEVDTQKGIEILDYTYPWRHSNAGHSWIVTLGKIQTFPGTDQLVYVAPDGTQHEFYYTLHGSNPAEQPEANVLYTRDGTYLRLKILASTYEIHFPNGHVHSFSKSTGLVNQIEDPFGNYVGVIYSNQTQGDPYPGSTLWTITDSTGRTHKVYFRPTPAYVEDEYGTPVAHESVHRVDLAAFGGSTAQWRFAYENEDSGFTTLSRRCGRRNDPTMKVVNAALLTSITLDGYLQYSMEYRKGDQANCSSAVPMPATSYASGNISKLTLPTGGWIEWMYQRYGFPQTNTAGVATRTIRKDASTILAQTTYELDQVPPAAFYYDVKRTVVEKDATFKTVHYFGACRVAPSPSTCTTGGLYGFPVTTSQSLDGAYLSTEVLEQNSSGDFVSVRKTYRKYEGDYFLTNVQQGQYNQRLSYEKTVYEDGSSASTTSTGFDGLGHYRSVTSTGSWDRQDSRTTYTGFNPNAGEYAVNENHVPTTAFTLPASGARWLLTTFDKERTTESRSGSAAVTSEAKVCFDSLGFLTAHRVYKDFGASPSPSPNDLTAVQISGRRLSVLLGEGVEICGLMDQTPAKIQELSKLFEG